MSWAMTNADIPYMISDALMGCRKPVVILLLINIVQNRRHFYGYDPSGADFHADISAHC